MSIYIPRNALKEIDLRGLDDKKVWVVMCGEDYGYGEVYDGLWGGGTRIYRTRRDAEKRVRSLRKTGYWSADNQIPKYFVEKMTLGEASEVHPMAAIDAEKFASLNDRIRKAAEVA